jgi:hypothetical protein
MITAVMTTTYNPALFSSAHVSFLHDACTRPADLDGERLEDGGDCRGAHGVERDEAQRRHKVEDWLGSARLPSGADGVEKDKEAERRMRRETERRRKDAELKRLLHHQLEHERQQKALEERRAELARARKQVLSQGSSRAPLSSRGVGDGSGAGTGMGLGGTDDEKLLRAATKERQARLRLMKARAEEEERARREEALHRRRAALAKDVENLRPRSEAWSPQTCPRLPTSQSGRHTHTTHTRRETGAQHGEGGAIDETEEPTERAPLGAPRSAGEGGSFVPTAFTAAHEAALASKVKASTHVRGAWGRADEEWVKKQDGVWTLQHSSSAGRAQQACEWHGCEADEHRQACQAAEHRQADAHRKVARGKSQEDSRQPEAGALGEDSSAGAGIGGQQGAGGRLEELLDKHREQQHLVQPLRSRSRRAGGGAGAAGRRLYAGDEPARNHVMSLQVSSHKPLTLKSPFYSELAQ